MSLALLSLLAADELRRNPDAVFCPVTDKDEACGRWFACHRPCDISRALADLPAAYLPMRWLCPERLARERRNLLSVSRPLPLEKIREAVVPERLGLEPYAAAGLSPLLRWLEESGSACFFFQQQRREDGFLTVFCAYLHFGSGITTHVVAAGPRDALSVMRTLRTRDEAEAWHSMLQFTEFGR